MAIKRRIKVADQAGRLADEIADKAYGKQKEAEQMVINQYVTTSISITDSMLRQLEDLALANKRSMSGPKNVSALIRLAVSDLLSNN